jgi:hypothetical protein
MSDTIQKVSEFFRIATGSTRDGITFNFILLLFLLLIPNFIDNNRMITDRATTLRANGDRFAAVTALQKIAPPNTRPPDSAVALEFGISDLSALALERLQLPNDHPFHVRYPPPGGVGYASGGNGGFDVNTNATGSGGGGSSAVVINDTPVVIAAGGGGTVATFGFGGSGGCLQGQNGVVEQNYPDFVFMGGSGALGPTGGPGGIRVLVETGCDDVNGTAGASALLGGAGGNGSSSSCPMVQNGGGGGAGYAGGGGGASCTGAYCDPNNDGGAGAGGGGSSLYPINGTCESGLNAFNQLDKSVGKNDPFYDFAYSGSGGTFTVTRGSYPGTPGQVVLVTDHDECILFVMCENGGTCVNTWGSWYCICPPEYSGVACQTRMTACNSFP